MTSILFILSAAICFAVVDVLSHHFPRSIFSELNPDWWNPKRSWRNSYTDWNNGKRDKRFLFIVSDANNSFTFLGVMFLILAIVTSEFDYIQNLNVYTVFLLILDTMILFFSYLGTYIFFYELAFRKWKNG